MGTSPMLTFWSYLICQIAWHGAGLQKPRQTESCFFFFFLCEVIEVSSASLQVDIVIRVK